MKNFTKVNAIILFVLLALGVMDVLLYGGYIDTDTLIGAVVLGYFGIVFWLVSKKL